MIREEEKPCVAAERNSSWLWRVHLFKYEKTCQDSRRPFSWGGKSQAGLIFVKIREQYTKYLTCF